MPRTLAESDAGPLAAIGHLQRWGFLADTDRAESLDAFVQLGLDRFEQRIGSFAGASHDGELVFLPDGRDYPAPCFGLRVNHCHVVHLRALHHRLCAFDDTLSPWFMLNLTGPAVFGPWFYSDIVRMTCWGGEDDERFMCSECGAEPGSPEASHIYTRAQFIADHAPWIIGTSRPENHAARLPRLAQFDKALAFHFERYLALRDELHGRLGTHEIPDVCPVDVVLFAWAEGDRITDLYDEYWQNEYNNGMTCEWAWLVKVESPADLTLLNRAAIYHAALTTLANYIKENFA